MKKTRNIRLDLEYDGSAFAGFQKQPDRATVQEALEKALGRLLGRPAKISAASGRTDAGVHAEGQVVNFLTDTPLGLVQIRKGLNAFLPREIAVTAAREVPAGFHARFGARSKIYEYRIWNHPVRSPLRRNRVCHIPYALDISAMRRAAGFLKGRRDFRSFAGTSSVGTEEGKSTVRTLRSLRILKSGKMLVLRMEADGFLYRMARNLAGALIEAGRGKMTPSAIPAILAARDRRRAPPTAPAEGLYMVRVRYG